jgi:hypothetical protein
MGNVLDLSSISKSSICFSSVHGNAKVYYLLSMKVRERKSKAVVTPTLKALIWEPWKMKGGRIEGAMHYF